ncbi:MAG: methyltransferase domain-containing protein [Phycisphaerales bacterium]|nr:methyltransferase domain-containing protein [Phycisphaerales bacterium]
MPPPSGPGRTRSRDNTSGPGRTRPGATFRWPCGIRLVHEDADLLILDKPSGLLTANVGPTQTGPSLFGDVKTYLRKHRNRGGRVFIIHRLDKEVSGLLVFAKTERAFNWLKNDFRSKRVHRLYLAVVEGEIHPEPAKGGSLVKPQPPGGTIQSFLHEDEFGQARSVKLGHVARAAKGINTRTAHPEDSRAPRLAVTHWRAVAAAKGYTLLQVRLETGRKNQIRVHMKEFGHPIAGDPRYGARTDPGRRLALHAAELGFTHPSTGQAVRFFSPAPDGFYRAVGMEPPDVPSFSSFSSPAPAAPGHATSTSPVPPLPASTPARGAGDAPVPTQPPPARAHAAEQHTGLRTHDTSWDHVADWYDDLIDERRSDHFDQVILPGTLRLLHPAAGQRTLDVACGQGELCRRLAALGVQAVGVDAAARLIQAAARRSGELPDSAPAYHVGDARALANVPLEGGFDSAACVMALMNINPLEAVFRGVADRLRPGGAFVGVILHPAFRAPGQTSWGWDGPAKKEDSKRRRDEARVRGEGRQYRRVDGYLSPGQTPIVMNPGAAASGAPEVTTWTFHRPIQAYVAALAAAGLLVDAIEEWPSLRESRPGPRAAEENRARREIPLFLAFRAIKG